MCTGIKKLFYVLAVSAAGLILNSCEPVPSRNTQTNLPQVQNFNKNQPPPKVAPLSPSPQANLNTNIAEPPVLAGNTLVNELTSNAEKANSERSASPQRRAEDNLTVVGKLRIPVAGVRPEDLRDTFNDSRSEGRFHDAIDIMAPEDTPVLAAADGEIARFFDSERGGITIYQFSSDRKMIFYYAHLKRRADNLTEKSPVKQGDVIGYVGDTGNSGKGNFHLHFAVWYVADEKRYWEGLNVNPYPLLRN
jgi:murein DD-endopeptidase MepM/ murein hydrolase activator NlpD